MTDFKIHFLGTASAVPTKERALSCIVVSYENNLAYFDCGEGSQRSAISSGLGFSKECQIFITHMHGDHVVGLLGLLQTMAMYRRERELHVFGPKSIIQFVIENKKLLNFGITYDLLVKEVRSGKVFEAKQSKYRVLAERSEHSTLSYSYIFEENAKPGKFYPDKASKLGVPEGPLWSELQHGKSVRSKTGKLVKPIQVCGPERSGKRIGISGDTRPNKKLEKFFKGCDVLIFDSTYSDEHEKNASENMHSTAREAAILARRARVKQLILTHFSARYTDISPLLNEAREEFPNTIAASDAMVYDVSAPSKP